MSEDIFKEGCKVPINATPIKAETSPFEDQLNNESICPECQVEMKCTKIKKSNRYKKNSTYYDCLICGYHHRKRTMNEILRDIGEKE